MRFISVYKLLLVLVIAVIGPRAHVTGIDCSFSWKCLITCGIYNCCKDKSCCGSNDDNDEVIYGGNKDPDPLDQSQHPTEVKVTTEGSTTENDTDKYKVYKRGDTYLYKFNQNVKCTAIKCSDAEVWKHTTDTATPTGSYPDSFTFNKTDSAFLLYFGLEYIKFTVDTSSGSWTGGEKQPLIKITTEGSDKENDKSKYDTSNPNPNTYEFTFKDGAKCTKVTHLDKDVWTYGTESASATGASESATPNNQVSGGQGSDSSQSGDGQSQGTKTGSDDGSQSGTPTTPTSGGTTATPPQYPKSILFNKKDNVFVFNFDSGTTLYKLNGDKWEEKPVEGIELDTNSTSGTNKYDYSKEQSGSTHIHSFVAKEGKGFKSVKKGNNTLWTAGNDVLVKAVLVRPGNSSTYTALILGGGNFERFYNNKKCETFLTISNGKVHETPFLSLTELKFYSKENDKSVEIPKDKYEDHILTSKFAYGFKFKDNVKCTEVKYGETSLKTFDKDHPSGIYLDLITNTFFAMVGDSKDLDSSKIGKKEGENKTSTNPGGTTPAN